MVKTEVVKTLIEAAEANDDDYFELVEAVAIIFPKGLVEQLRQLVNGPIYDGDIISKADRGDLFDVGLAIRVCHKGEQGFTGAKYIAWSILKTIDQRASA